MAFDLASGVRVPWGSLPPAVRGRIEAILGSAVVSAVNQSGGFSPGLAARVRTADGTRAFVKACGPELNPDSPRIYRAEAATAPRLTSEVPAPRLRGTAGADADVDDGLDGWVVLVFDELDASPVPTPWSEPDIRRTLATLDRLATAATPCPVPGLTSAGDRLVPMVTEYATLAEAPPGDLDPWERRHLPELAESGLAAVAAAEGDCLVHLDARSDNIMVDGTGAVWLVDWPFACRGAPWLDAACVLLDVALYGGDPEQYLDGSRTLADADPDAVTAFVTGLSGMFARQSRQPDPPGLPTLRAFQRASHVAALAWLRRRRPDLR